MTLQNIAAAAHPDGNRIDLTWTHPDPETYPAIRLVRGQGTFPQQPEEGELVAEGADLTFTELADGGRGYRYSDRRVQGETVYYYALFPFVFKDTREYLIDKRNRVSVMATGAYGSAARMFDLLPRVYHRYDAAASGAGVTLTTDPEKGLLRRFLDLAGGQLDQLQSHAVAAANLYNLDKIDGRLLPLLAQWIGWDLDRRAECDVQRNALRRAPHLYETIGTVPTIQATVKQVLGLESRVKEFVHNVIKTNSPERLNLWEQTRGLDGNWTEPRTPLSLDFSYGGGATLLDDGGNTSHLIYHAFENGRWSLRSKPLLNFTAAGSVSDDLKDGIISQELRDAFTAAGATLSQKPELTDENPWHLLDGDTEYTIRAGLNSVEISHWLPSNAFTAGNVIEKDPRAVIWNDLGLVFWNVFLETESRWQIRYRVFGQPTTIQIADGVERKSPQALVDDTGALWLFWQEREDPIWRLKYKVFKAGEPINLSGALTLNDDQDDRVEADLSVLFHPDEKRIWVFWARKQPLTARTHWFIAFRTKLDLDPANANWEPLKELPKSGVGGAYDDREPVAVPNPAGGVEMFWSANSENGWSIWQGDPENPAGAKAVTKDPYSQRSPTVIADNAGVRLLYRSNRSPVYTGSLYGSTRTVDFRYAGGVTLDTRNRQKTALHRSFDDFQTYTYDTGPNGKPNRSTWYQRGAVGIYLVQDDEPPAFFAENQNLIDKLIQNFLPIQARTVFILETPPVGDQFKSQLTDFYYDAAITEMFPVPHDDDPLQNQPAWARTWSPDPGSRQHYIANTSSDPIDPGSQIWQKTSKPEE